MPWHNGIAFKHTFHSHMIAWYAIGTVQPPSRHYFGYETLLHLPANCPKNSQGRKRVRHLVYYKGFAIATWWQGAPVYLNRPDLASTYPSTVFKYSKTMWNFFYSHVSNRGTNWDKVPAMPFKRRSKQTHARNSLKQFPQHVFQKWTNQKKLLSHSIFVSTIKAIRTRYWESFHHPILLLNYDTISCIFCWLELHGTHYIDGYVF